MKIQFTINTEEKQKILKDFLLLNFFTGKELTHDQIEIEISADSSGQDIPEISIFKNILPASDETPCEVLVTFPNKEPTFTNCVDRWNGRNANGFQPRYARRWYGDQHYDCYIFDDNKEQMVNKAVTEAEAHAFVKQAPRLN